MIIIISISIFTVLLLLGAPVAFCLLVSGAIGILGIAGPNALFGILESAPMSTLGSFEFITIPMFILMAQILTISGIASNLFDATAVWLGKMRGGLAIATTLTGAAFGALSGSSTASAATLSATSIPAMVKRGYDPDLACGVVAISGTLAMLIPPSIAIIFYGLLSGDSIAKLLIAGILPGVLVTLTIIATVLVLVAHNPAVAPGGRSYPWMEKVRSLRILGPFAFIFAFVTGTIYLGVATPVEASVLGAVASIFYALALRKLTWLRFYDAVVESLRTTSMIALILICAQIFSYFLTLTQIPQSLVSLVGSSGLPREVILALIILLYLVLGCFLDLISTLILTVPLVLPIIRELGYDSIWFGIVIIVVAEIGLITPPVGLNVFVVSKYAAVPVGRVFRGIVPHFIAHLVVIGLLCVFPAIVLWLPGFVN